MLSFLTILKNEILSYFVPEKMEYKITGKCLKCGKCCRYMYSFDTYTTTDFKIMQFLFPAYRRFYIRGKDEEGNLIFACKYVTEEFAPMLFSFRLIWVRYFLSKTCLYIRYRMFFPHIP